MQRQLSCSIKRTYKRAVQLFEMVFRLYAAVKSQFECRALTASAHRLLMKAPRMSSLLSSTSETPKIKVLIARAMARSN